MTTIDLILLAIIGIALVTGWLRGLARQVGTVAGIILGIVICRVFGSDLADYFVSRGSEHASVARACVYAVLFVAVYLGCNLLARLISSLLKAVKLGFLDRLGGAVMRTFLWLLFTSLAINIYLGICPSDRPRFERADKPWRNITVQLAPKLLGYLAN